MAGPINRAVEAKTAVIQVLGTRSARVDTRPQPFVYLRSFDAGWSSLVARRAHNPKVAGSNPAPAI